MQAISLFLRGLRAWGMRRKLVRPGRPTASAICLGVCALCGGACARHIHADEHRCVRHAWLVGAQ